MNEETIAPLPYNVPHPIPRSSFAQYLQLSSYLFPSNHLSVSSSSTRGDEDKEHRERYCRRNPNTALDHTSFDTKDCDMTTIANNKTKSKKKVTFKCYVISISPRHRPTEDEKRRMWYTNEEYDSFKFNAANNAGVRLFDYFPPEQKQSSTDGSTEQPTYPPHKFVMLGNFDQSENRSTLPTDATIAERMHASRPASHHVPIKCQNEYADTISHTGDEICKRGLGYHFSRYRKKNRVWTRVMVLTWQKTMRSMKVEDGRIQNQLRPSEQQELKLSQKCAVKLNEKSQRLLAVISSKCSRSSKQAALWRGKMDYEIAHPDNRKVSFDLGVDDCTKNEVDSNKRAANDCDGQASRKRQRCDRGNDANAYTYLAGVLAVPI
jgi:hypothetical protein